MMGFLTGPPVGLAPLRERGCGRLFGWVGVGVGRSGGYGGGETPGPIPNPVVKPSSADGTAWETVWESRSPPEHTR